MQTKDFDYHLPPELIAQQPAPERDQARLMLVDRATGEISHYRAADLPVLLKQGDLMVLNDTRVIPARIFGKKQKTGGKVEVLFIEESGKNTWQVFLHSSGRPQAGDILLLANDKIKAQVKSTGAYGRVLLGISCAKDFSEVLEEEGLPPLPPYIKRPRDERSAAICRRQKQLDSERYQTVYARVPGAIAAPTAGLHFSNGLLAALERAGIQRTEITLHVGPGTFIPVRCERIEDHKMEPERFIIGPQAARKINAAIAEKRRIVAVGTTVVRALESAVTSDIHNIRNYYSHWPRCHSERSEESRLQSSTWRRSVRCAPAVAKAMVDRQDDRTCDLMNSSIHAGSGATNLFIHPPYRFKVVNALLTNFHLPRSTLLMLVSAFTGRELIRHAYEIAVKEKYRFYSYGDCMLIM